MVATMAAAISTRSSRPYHASQNVGRTMTVSTRWLPIHLPSALVERISNR